MHAVERELRVRRAARVRVDILNLMPSQMGQRRLVELPREGIAHPWTLPRWQLLIRDGRDAQPIEPRALMLAMPLNHPLQRREEALERALKGLEAIAARDGLRIACTVARWILHVPNPKRQ